MELDFASDTVEKLLLKKVLTDREWTDTLSKVFDRRWFKTRHMGVVLGFILKFYDKYGRTPQVPVVAALAKKYAENHPGEGFDVAEANALVSEALSMQAPDEDITRENLREFIRKNALSASLIDNINILSDAEHERDSEKYQKIIDRCLENFDRIQKLTFDGDDLGFDYFDKA